MRTWFHPTGKYSDRGLARTGKALASDYVSERLRASGIGWYNTTVGLCGLVASVAAGWLWDHVGHAAVFLFGAGFAVIGGIALLALVPADLKKRES
jgi:MFS family permease